MKNTRVMAAIAGLVASMALLVGCGAAAPQGGGGEESDAVFRFGSTVEPQSFDPAGSGTGPLQVFGLVAYDTLLMLDDEGQPGPWLATDFAWNDDSTELSLDLRDDVDFSDGAHFDAEAVKANIEHFQELGGQAGPVLRLVDSVEVTDEYAVTLHLSAPDPSLLFTLTGPGGAMGSPEALGTDEIVSVPVGSGPYVMDTDQTIAGSEYVFTRNEDYWGGSVPYAEFRILAMPDETARTNALVSGQLNAAHLRNPQQARQAEASGSHLYESDGSWEGIFFLDRDGELAEPLKDKRVREALRIAIDADTMVDSVLGGDGTVTSQIFPPTADAYREEWDHYYEYDPDRAKDLLAEAGYPDGFTVPLPETGTVAPEVYTAIQQYWADIGVTAEPFQWGQGEAIPSIQAGEFAAPYFSNILQDSWTTVNFSVAPEARYNPFGSETDELDGLIETMQYATDDERAEAGQAVNEYLLENAWFGPLYRPRLFVAMDTANDVQDSPGYQLPPALRFAHSGS